MKRIIKNPIFTFVLGLIVASGVVGALAYSYQSSEISYTTSHNSSVQNVEQAINDLYAKVELSMKEKLDTFSTDSWATIVANVKAGKTYRLGQTKTVNMGTFGTHTLRVSNISTQPECSTTGFSQTGCGFVLEFADIITKRGMNSSDTSEGGWPATSMRTYVNNDIYNALPSDLKSGIINTTVVSGYDGGTYTSTDKLYLLSLKEVEQGWDSYDKAASLTRTLDIYMRDDWWVPAGKGDNWWFRTAYYRGFLDSRSFGSRDENNASSAEGVSPAFRIG